MTQQEKDALFMLIRYAMGIDNVIPDDQKENIIKMIPVLYKQSKRHDLAHIVGDALFKAGLICPDNEYYEKFKKRQIVAIFREATISRDLAEICDAFEGAAIPFVPLKGSVIRDRYPEKWMRTSSDIDILVKKEDLQRAIELLTSQRGFTYSSKYVHHVSLSSKNKTHIEIHHELLEDCTANDANLVLGDIWSLVKPKKGYSYWHEMKDEHFYLYHIAHAAKHVINGGCGIKPILDLWILENKVKHNQEKRAKLLKIANLSAFDSMCRDLCSAWFCGEKISREEVGLLESYIITGGVHGTPLNHLSIQQQRKGGKSGYAKDVIFPPYDVMRKLFPILQKHRWLTGPFYIIRIIISIFKGTAPKVMKRLLYNSKSPKRVDDAVLLMLEKSELK